MNITWSNIYASWWSSGLFCTYPKKNTSQLEHLDQILSISSPMANSSIFYSEYVGLDVFWDILIITSMRSCHRSC